jgi:hypothetical protein
MSASPRPRPARSIGLSHHRLDLVVARDEWSRRQLGQLLGLTEQEATELLTSMGFEADKADEDVWTPSADPDKSMLRRRIIRDSLHRPDDEEDDD